MSTRLKILLPALGGVALCVGVFQVWYFGLLGDGGAASPEDLVQQALNAPTSAERAEAAVKLGDCGPEVRDELRQVFEGSDSPQVRAACIQGLSAIQDYDSMDVFLDCLEDESLVVRGSAGSAISTMLLGAGELGADKLKVEFKADGSDEERQKAIKIYRGAWDKLRGSPLLHQHINKSQEDREDEN